MGQARRQSMRMVFVLVVSAIFCAVATFIAITLVVNRPSTPQADQPLGPQQVVVDGLVVTLKTDPEKAVYMPAALLPTVVAEAGENGLLPTDVPLPTPTLPLPTRAPESIIFISYVVKQGDSLYSIGREQNSSIELMALHGIDADDLIPGATLTLPVANSAYCPLTRAYVVRDHDTAYGVATACNTTPEAIRALNGLDENYTIKTTEVICVPCG